MDKKNKGFAHLPLLRIDIEKERKKGEGFPGRDYGIKNYKKHGEKIEQEMVNIIQQAKAKDVIDPALIFKIVYKESIKEGKFDTLNLTLLSNAGAQGENNYILFSDNEQMEMFFEKVNLYKQGITVNKTPHYNDFFSSIIDVLPLTAEDRKGHRLKNIQIKDNENYWINLELWHLGDTQRMREKITLYRNTIQQLGGKATDDCLGNSFCLLRVNCNGHLLKFLLEEDNVCEIDLIPEKVMGLNILVRDDIKDINYEGEPSPDAPRICIVDSGITYGHPLLENAVKDVRAFGERLDNGVDENGMVL